MVQKETRGHKDDVQMTFSDTDTMQKNLMSAASLTYSSPEMRGPRVGGKEVGGGPGGRAGEELTGFYFDITLLSWTP